MSFFDALLLRGGANTTWVVAGTTLLGVAGGVAGSFALFRQRSLFADALGHATLPGVCAAFLAAHALGGSGRSLPVLLAGAAGAALVATVCMQAMLRWSRLREDAVIGVVLSVSFGIGIVLLSYIQTLPSGDQGGLKTFLFGQTAAMQQQDALTMGAIALAAVLVGWAFFKEFALLAFDEAFAVATGLPVALLDLLLLLLVVATTVAGLQAVGLVLVIALLVIPAVSARLWTDRAATAVVLAAVFGALGGWIGSSWSSVAPRLPAGAVIVLVSAAFFVVGLLVAPRGVVASLTRRTRLSLRTTTDHVLKSLLDQEQSTEELARSIGARPWSLRPLLCVLRLRGRVDRSGSMWRLTEKGRAVGAAIARNHALWTAYLVRDAAVAPDHVDPSAEAVEHILDDELVRALEASLPPSKGRGP
jgi:manganese/zinc/iron transport system permease protein